jgi:hypothetical protein
MKDHLAASPIVLLVLALAGCAGPYSGPVTVPRDLGGSDLADCHAFLPAVWDDGRTPRPAEHVTATCADPSICTAYVEHAEVVVWGNRPGATSVLVQFDHPTTGEHGAAKIPVAFDPPTRTDWLRPRVSDPTGCRREHQRPAAPAQAAP